MGWIVVQPIFINELIVLLNFKEENYGSRRMVYRKRRGTKGV